MACINKNIRNETIIWWLICWLICTSRRTIGLSGRLSFSITPLGTGIIAMRWCLEGRDFKPFLESVVFELFSSRLVICRYCKVADNSVFFYEMVFKPWLAESGGKAVSQKFWVIDFDSILEATNNICCHYTRKNFGSYVTIKFKFELNYQVHWFSFEFVIIVALWRFRKSFSQNNISQDVEKIIRWCFESEYYTFTSMKGKL